MSSLTLNSPPRARQWVATRKIATSTIADHTTKPPRLKMSPMSALWHSSRGSGLKIGML